MSMAKASSQRLENSAAIPMSSRGSYELLRPLFGPLKKNWILASLTIIAGWGKFMLPLVIGYAAKVVIDVLAMESVSKQERLDILTFWCVISGLAIIACAVATYFRAALGQKLSARVQHRLRGRLFHHLQRLGMDFFVKNHAGALGSRVGSDIQQVAMVIDRGLITVAMDFATILVIATVLFIVNWQLTLLSFLVLAISGVSIAYHAPRLRRRRKAVQESQSAITGRAAETFAGISLVKAYAGETETGRAFTSHSHELQELQVDTSRIQGRFQSISLALVMASQLVILGFGGWLAITQPSLLTVGGLVLFMTYLRWIESSVQRVVEGMIQLQDGMAALDRLGDMFAIQPDPPEPEDGAKPALKGDIRFQNVAFAYEQGRPVIQDFDLHLQAGQTYALVGPSGGGKVRCVN